MTKKRIINWTLIFSIVLLVAIISISFCWNERINLTLRINHEKVTNFFITLFTALGTCATIYYTSKQIRITEVSNRSNIKPDFIPKPAVVKMMDISSEKDHNDKIVLAHPDLTESSKIVLENIGIGVSKELKYEWVFDKERVLEIIKGIYHLAPDDSAKSYQYLASRQSVEIGLPFQYLSCCGPKLFTHNKILGENLDFEEMNPITLWQFYIQVPDKENSRIRPPLTLKLTYTDIQDNLYSQKFSVNLKRINETILLTFETSS